MPPWPGVPEEPPDDMDWRNPMNMSAREKPGRPSSMDHWFTLIGSVEVLVIGGIG
jgi:hypothetical protein